jgi:hypothetical protein
MNFVVQVRALVLSVLPAALRDLVLLYLMMPSSTVRSLTGATVDALVACVSLRAGVFVSQALAVLDGSQLVELSLVRLRPGNRPRLYSDRPPSFDHFEAPISAPLLRKFTTKEVGLDAAPDSPAAAVLP